MIGAAGCTTVQGGHGEDIVQPAASAAVKKFRDCDQCPEMSIVPAGSFPMGGRSVNDRPTHVVSVTRPFAIGVTTITQGQWDAVMGTRPEEPSSCGRADDCPKVNVSWDESQLFLGKLSKLAGHHYRLPSEAEWEYACRAGQIQKYCGGDDIDSVAWYGRDGYAGGNSAQSIHPVAGRHANAWGLYDMSGNVYQWTEDCWHVDYEGAPVDGTAWITPACSLRVQRGSAWNDQPGASVPTRRWGWAPSFRASFVGLRVVRDMP